MKTLLQLPTPPVPALPAPFISSLERHSVTRLPSVQRMAAEAPATDRVTEPHLRTAHAALVSAACYLSLTPATNSAAALEAVQMLHDLSQEVLRSIALPDTLRVEIEDRVWQHKQLRWERQRSVEAAIRYVKAGAELRQTASPRRSRSRAMRWWNALRRPAQVYPF